MAKSDNGSSNGMAENVGSENRSSMSSKWRLRNGEMAA